MTASVHELPGSLRLTSTFPFVGRSAELSTLRTLMPWAKGEERRVVLIGGEPGSGKSRLVREFALEAAGDGALVLYGACDAVVRTPYGPFVEALDHLTRVTEPAELQAALGTGGGELTRLLPDLSARIGGLPPPVDADPDTERHRLHTAVANLLANVTARVPALVVLEDGHWADAATLLLLRHLARAAGGARMLLAATFRDTEADVPETLAEALADLRRADDVIRLRLGGLSDEEVAELVRRASETDLGPGLTELARGMRDLTNGNAFLLCELWRALIEAADHGESGRAVELTRQLAEIGSPESVREVVSQRLARLAPGTRAVLELAATAGSEFDLDLVRRAAGLDEPELLAALDEGVKSGMIEELPSRRLGCRFTHELVRRALYDRLTGVRRAELHMRVGEALEAGEPRSGRTLADLAHHFAAAARVGGAARGVEYNLQAGRAAIGALAFDQAAARLRTAIELGIEDRQERADAFLDLGTASHRGGNAVDALDAFTAAAGIARELGAAPLLARAAIGYEETCWRPGIADQGAVELLEEAAEALGDETSELRVGLLAGLARALDFQGAYERAGVVRANAISMARQLGDRVGLATVLMRAYWSRSTGLGTVLEMLTEARDLGGELGNTEIRAEAMAWRVPAFVTLCDLESARRELTVLLETAERTAQPFILHVAAHYGSSIALCDGRLEEAETLARRSHEWSRLLTGRDASGVYGIQMFSVRRAQGRVAELAPVVRMLASEATRQDHWRPGLVALLAELGMESEAKRELTRITADGLGPLRESLWLASLTYLADAAAALGDESTAALVYPELEPLAGANVMIGHLVSCYGSGDRYLGMLAGILGDAGKAEAHFERALDLNRRMGAVTWFAETAFEYGRFLLGRGPRSRSRAEALLGEAASIGERLGMSALVRKVHAAGPATTRASLPDGLSPREVQILDLVARGLSNREIGRALSISEHTAANHVRSILRKTGCSNRTEAASYAHRHGLASTAEHAR